MSDTIIQALQAVCDDLARFNPNAPSLHFARGMIAAGAIAPAPVAAPAYHPVIAATALAFGYGPDELVSARREQPLAEARFAAMLVLRRQGQSFPAIARLLQRNDHTTVIHGVTRAEELEREAPAFARAVEQITAGTVGSVVVPPPPRKGEAKARANADRKARDAEIVAAYRDGLSLLQCVTQFHVTAATIKRALRQHGVPLRRGGGRPPRLDKIETIMAMRAEGKSGEEIGRALGITRERVRQIVVQCGKQEEFAERPLTPEQLAICKQYEAGDNLHMTAQKLGVSLPTARNYLTRAGIKVRPSLKSAAAKLRTRALAEQIAARYRAGERIRDIAKAEGFANNAAIYRYLAIAGVKPGRQSRAWMRAKVA